MCGAARVPRGLPDQHGPVQLALDVRVARAAGVDERVHGHQDEALRVELPHLNRQLPDRGEAEHGRHRHLCGRRRTGEAKTRMRYITNGIERKKKKKKHAEPYLEGKRRGNKDERGDKRCEGTKTEHVSL